jgi:hypothetical protein
MSYIDLINQFWRMNRIDPFTPTEVCLYFYLLSQWNNYNREEKFEIGTRSLLNELRMTDRTFFSVRDSLRDKGLINFTKGERRSSSPVYQILENVDIGRPMRTAEPEAETEMPEEIEVDEIPSPTPTPGPVPEDQKPVQKPPKRKKIEKPLDELFKTPEPEKRKKKEFVPPTLQEVEDFFSGLGVIDALEKAQQFYFHYDSLGWHTSSGAAIWRWDSLANKWLLNDKQKEYENNRSSSKKSGEGNGYKESLNERFAESERRFREENRDR